MLKLARVTLTFFLHNTHFLFSPPSGFIARIPEFGPEKRIHLADSISGPLLLLTEPTKKGEKEEKEKHSTTTIQNE
jgi:hypothetical protein